MKLLKKIYRFLFKPKIADLPEEKQKKAIASIRAGRIGTGRREG